MSLSDTMREIAAELESLDGATDDISRMRRITLNNAMADTLYGLSDILKQQGDRASADEAHRLANQHWGRVVEDAGDLNNE